ncbi:MAG TPA: hypothetical protein VII45_07750 [Solirubrobacterales bacterium]
MKKRLKLHLPSHTTVAAYLSLFLVVSGGAAFAATQLHKNSVGTKQLKNNAVAAAKIKNSAVTAGKIAANAVTANAIADGSVSSGKLGNEAVTTGKLANNAVTTGKLGNESVATGKLASNSVTTGKIVDNAVTGAKVDEGSLHFTCNNPADAVLILGGPCLYKRTTAGSTWVEAIQACQVGVPGATLPTVAQVEAYARLGGVPWKEVVAFTSDLVGSGTNPSGAWSVQTDANGTVTVILATALTSNTQTSVLCEYDPATDPTPGS